MLPWSVIATAVIPSRAASANSRPTLAAPSSIEYSVCTCRWTNESDTAPPWKRGVTDKINRIAPTLVDASAGISVAYGQ